MWCVNGIHNETKFLNAEALSADSDLSCRIFYRVYFLPRRTGQPQPSAGHIINSKVILLLWAFLPLRQIRFFSCIQVSYFVMFCLQLRFLTFTWLKTQISIIQGDGKEGFWGHQDRQVVKTVLKASYPVIEQSAWLWLIYIGWVLKTPSCSCWPGLHISGGTLAHSSLYKLSKSFKVIGCHLPSWSFSSFHIISRGGLETG